MRPRLFIGSSKEALEIASAIQENLDDVAETIVWTQAFFGPSNGVLETLTEELPGFDFGVFVFTGDDVVRLRDDDQKAVRDNVVFEMGLFVGHLGRERVFFVVPRGREGPLIPSDLTGIVAATFNPDRRDSNLTAALGPACAKIRRALRTLGLRDGSTKREIDLKSATLLAARALSKVRLIGCKVSPLSLRRGERVSITYEVSSECPETITVWLGADCWPHYNVGEDLEVKVTEGIHSFHRWLTVGDNWPSGSHNLAIGLWVGPKSNPDDSLRLAMRHPAATIEVT